MIISRIVQTLREGEWTRLGLELLLIVVGIFLGLQVDDWNESRKESVQEGIYLERLQADVEQMLQAHRVHEAGAERRIADIVISLRALAECSLSGESIRAFEETLLNHQGLARISVVRTTYDEMVASGALARLEDLDLKAGIADVYAFAEESQAYVEYFSADLGRASQIIWQHVSFQVRPDAGLDFQDLKTLQGEQFSQTVEFDFEPLCSEPEFINALVEVFDSSKDRLGIGAEFAQRLEKLHSLLSVQLAKSG